MVGLMGGQTVSDINIQILLLMENRVFGSDVRTASSLLGAKDMFIHTAMAEEEFSRSRI